MTSPSCPLRPGLLLLSGLAILLSGAVPAPLGRADQAFARRVAAAEDLVRGPVAAGRVGDWVIGNGSFRAIISAADRSVGFAFSGGNVIDVAPEGGKDLLQLIFTYLDDTFPRQIVYRTVAIESPGGGGKPAVIAVEGVDSRDPSCVIG